MTGPVTLNADDGTPLPRTAELITELTITFGVDYTRVLVRAVEQANLNNQASYGRGLCAAIDILAGTGIARPVAEAVALGHVASFLAVIGADATAIEEQRAKWMRN